MAVEEVTTEEAEDLLDVVGIPDEVLEVARVRDDDEPQAAKSDDETIPQLP